MQKSEVGFRAHDPKYGPKLAQSQASGLSRLARLAEGADLQAARVEAARARLRAELQAQRSVTGQARAKAFEASISVALEDVSSAIDRYTLGNESERAVSERGTNEHHDGVKPALSSSTGKLRRGRPKVEGVRPWEAAGMSRRTWERRRKA